MKLKRIKDAVAQPLEDAVQKTLSSEDFQFAKYNAEESERSGYSNYSYWGSTFRCFVKKKLAMSLLIVLAVLVLFTLIQPYLPLQFPAYVFKTAHQNPLPFIPLYSSAAPMII